MTTTCICQWNTNPDLNAGNVIHSKVGMCKDSVKIPRRESCSGLMDALGQRSMNISWEK